MTHQRDQRRLAVALFAGTAIVSIAAPAYAQQEPPREDIAQPADEAGTVDTASTEADTAAAADGDIIVTARRREESLQDTPVAITAINAAMLENKASVNIGDLMGAAPNLLITNQNSGAAAANLSIRGLTYADIEKSQEPTVAVVVDGVFIGTSTGQFFDFFDIDQIEVLRGPQGTLFGRNTIGGVINIRRTRPKHEFTGKAEVSYGKYETLATRAVVNIPIIQGVIAVKPFYFHNESDGYYRHGITGKRVGSSNNENFGIALLAQPTENFDALLTLEKQIQKFDPINSNIARTGELFCLFEPANECNRNQTDDLYTVFNSPAISKYRSPAATLEMNLDAGPVKLTSVTGFRKSDEFQTQDFDASSVDLYFTQRRQDYKQFSQELRGAGKLTDSFDYVVGVYYFRSNYELLQHTRLFGFDTSIPPDVADPNPQTNRGKTRSYAAFGDFNWAFADQWRLSFGGRYTRDKKKLFNAFAQTGVIGQGSDTFSKFTPKVGVDFRPNQDTMIYASRARGYRSGGFSPRAATAATAAQSYGPETVDSFELGTKLDLFDRRLQFNVAAFYSKYKDLQQNTTIPGGPLGNQTITDNVGSAKIKGIEVDFTARPVKNLRLTGSAGLLHAEFKDFVVGNLSPATGLPIPFDYSNNNPIYSPKFSGSLTADYTIPTSFGEVAANVGYRYIGRYDQQISLGPLSGDLVNGPVIVNGNDPRVRSDRQNLLDVSLTGRFTLDNGREAYVTVFGRNLLDDRGPNAAFTVAGLWSFASAREPRTYGATLGFKF
jgi:iron complex outermembrane recepter protein